MSHLIIMQILDLLMYDFVHIHKKHVNTENCIESCKNIENAHTHTHPLNIYQGTQFTCVL